MNESNVKTEANVAYFIQGNSRLIRKRLRELDREWAIERGLEANAAIVALVGLALGRFINGGWFLLPTIVAGFLLSMPFKAGVLLSLSFAG